MAFDALCYRSVLAENSIERRWRRSVGGGFRQKSHRLFCLCSRPAAISRGEEAHASGGGEGSITTGQRCGLFYRWWDRLMRVGRTSHSCRERNQALYAPSTSNSIWQVEGRVGCEQRCVRSDPSPPLLTCLAWSSSISSLTFIWFSVMSL